MCNPQQSIRVRSPSPHSSFSTHLRFSQILKITLRGLIVMIPIITSSRFGVGSCTASLALTSEIHNGRRKAINMAGRHVDILPTRSMPIWMRYPRRIFTTGRRRSMNATSYAPSLQHGNKAVTKAVNNGGLLVRGGGGAVSTGGQLGGVLFATALFSAVLERSTKAGAVVGAPLLSFATFCILRCHKSRCCVGSMKYFYPALSSTSQHFVRH